jgi:hypothetical protein
VRGSAFAGRVISLHTLHRATVPQLGQRVENADDGRLRLLDVAPTKWNLSTTSAPGTVAYQRTTVQRAAMRRISAAVTAIVVVLAGWAGVPALAQPASQAAGAPQYPHRLTSAEIRDRQSDATFYTIGQYGPKTYTGYFSSGGQIKWRGPGALDVGTWRVTNDDLLCTKYTKLRDGQETCQAIWQTGPDSFEARLPNGQIFRSAGRVSGNPEGL